MDEMEQLRRFRAALSDAPDEQTSRVRSAVDRAIEANAPSALAITGPRTRWRVAFAGAIAALVAVIVVVVALPGGGGSRDATQNRSLASFAAEIQSYTQLDFEHLADLGLTLQDVAGKADVVGTGRIVDIRLGYEEGDALQHMFLVVQPDRLASGETLLGESGEVLVDRNAPPVDRETGSRGIEELREIVVGSPERVAFMLSPTPPSTYANSPNEYAGRAKDDPIFWPTHPSSLFALDEQGGVAYPLVTDEKLEDSPANLDALEQLGATVDSFAKGADTASGAQP